MTESDRLTSMNYWWPLVQDCGVPMPRTQIVPVGEREIRDWFCGMAHGIVAHTAGTTDPAWLDELRKVASGFVYPLFLRTDLCSGKHGWRRTCHVPGPELLRWHAFNILEDIELQFLMGLPNSAWVLRELLQHSAWVLRELLQPWQGFTAFEGMPIGKERRYFVRDGAVQCHHPYWPAEAFRFSTDDPRREALAALSDETDDVALLTDYATRLAAVLPGYWTLDFYCDAAGKWWFIDAAAGEVSWHPECEFEETKP